MDNLSRITEIEVNRWNCNIVVVSSIRLPDNSRLMYEDYTFSRVLGILGPGFLQKIRDSKETVKSK